MSELMQLAAFSTLCDASQQSTKHQRVDRQDRIPVDAAEEPARIESGGLTNLRAPAAFDRRDLEFQPPSAGELHVSGQSHQPIGFVRLHCPAIDDIADHAMFPVAPATHADPSNNTVEPATYLPEVIAEVPTGRAADAPNRCKGL